MKHELNLFEPEQDESPFVNGFDILTRDQSSYIKKIIEALLFASSEPVSFNKIREIIDTIQKLSPRVLRQIIFDLKNDYATEQRSFALEEIAHGFILRTRSEFSRFIDLLYRNKRAEKLSSAATEVLAIIAYRQPITRGQIEAIRGVDSSGVIGSLVERQLIEPIGKSETAGRPMLYGITKHFLAHFGMRDLCDLKELHSTEPT